MSVTAPSPGPSAQSQAPDPQGAGAPPAPAVHPATGKFPDLHSLSVDIQSDLGALSSGLARAGATPDVVHRISEMSGTISDVAKILSAAPPVPNPSHGQGEPEPQQQAAQPAPHQPANPQAQALAGPRIPNPHAALGQAVDFLHRGMQASAQAQQPGS